jgi:hypothetical protein
MMLHACAPPAGPGRGRCEARKAACVSCRAEPSPAGGGVRAGTEWEMFYFFDARSH